MPQPQKPEQEARDKIDELLTAAGWQLQNIDELNLSFPGVAVREYPTDVGFVDYVLFVKGSPVGVIEAKKKGDTLSGVVDQTDSYLRSKLKHIPIAKQALTFGYVSTGEETMFYDIRDPDCRPRGVFAFHKPDKLAEWLQEPNTLRARMREMPPIITKGMRDCQIEAITNLEASFAKSKPRALISMSTGSGKSFLAVSFIYRLIKFAGAKHILFLVDRRTLGIQASTEFQKYETPDDHRKFIELYNIQLMSSNTIDPVCNVTITTIQRLFSMLKGTEFDPELDEHSAFDLTLDNDPKPIEYNPTIPIEAFDFIVTDECHRSIYNQWRQVLDYFDAFIVGLTATPSKQTLGFFKQNQVMDFNHQRAIAEGVNVGYEVYRIKTNASVKGGKVEAGEYIDKRNKMTRKVRYELLDEDLYYAPTQLDKDIVMVDQIRTVIQTFRDKLFTEIFPGRTEVPKTLIFAKTDSHAEDIVNIIWDEFGKGKDFAKKITYRTTGETPEALIAAFRNEYFPRIAVTVDMISTGTDIKPLECLLFMRDIKSAVYFEQMKGRGTRVIDSNALQLVSPDAKAKTHFVIVDAIGVCESDKGDSRPLERKKSIPFDRLLLAIAAGNREEDYLISLGNRLAQMDRQLSKEDRKRIQDVAGVASMTELILPLFTAFDPDVQVETACKKFATDNPTVEQLKIVTGELAETVAKPFHDPKLRNLLIETKQLLEQTIDIVSQDFVLEAGFNSKAKEAAQQYVQSWQQYLQDHRDEITALQILYSQPYGKRKLTYDAIRELADTIKRPPNGFIPERLWHCYDQLEHSRVKGQPKSVLTDLVSLVKFTSGMADDLTPFIDIVEHRFHDWLQQQQQSGRSFTPQQLEWLQMIKEHIATSIEITEDDFESIPFNLKGGIYKFSELFGKDYQRVMDELNKVLAG